MLSRLLVVLPAPRRDLDERAKSCPVIDVVPVRLHERIATAAAGPPDWFETAPPLRICDSVMTPAAQNRFHTLSLRLAGKLEDSGQTDREDGKANLGNIPVRVRD